MRRSVSPPPPTPAAGLDAALRGLGWAGDDAERADLAGAGGPPAPATIAAEREGPPSDDWRWWPSGLLGDGEGDAVARGDDVEEERARGEGDDRGDDEVAVGEEDRRGESVSPGRGEPTRTPSGRSAPGK
jgi:hypothetical protein